MANRNSVHRYSLPSNNFSSPYRANVGNDSFAGTKHLFNRDNEKHVFNAEHRLSTPDIQGYMKMTEPDDKFPTLFRRGGSNIVSSDLFAALDRTESFLTWIRTVVCQP